MRTRVIASPGLKAPLAAGVALLGAACVAWSVMGPGLGLVAAPQAARAMGFVALVVGSLAALNFLSAHILVLRLRRGDGVVAAWTVAPATLAAFQTSERARKRVNNNWRGWRKGGPAGLR